MIMAIIKGITRPDPLLDMARSMTPLRVPVMPLVSTEVPKWFVLVQGDAWTPTLNKVLVDDSRDMAEA